MPSRCLLLQWIEARRLHQIQGGPEGATITQLNTGT